MSKWSLDLKTVQGSKTEWKTTATSEEALETLAEEIMKGSASIILWQNNAVLAGRYTKEGFEFPETGKLNFGQFVEMRIFNENEELYVSGNEYRYRSELVGDAESFEVVDTASRLWGELSEDDYSIPGYVRLKDKERKLNLIFPYEGNKTKYYELVVRSYVGVAEATGQVGYTDYRFVTIKEGRE